MAERDQEAVQAGSQRDGGEYNLAPVRGGLPLEVKQRIVAMFASFQGLTAIERELKAEYGLALDHRTLSRYDPARPHARIGKGLRLLYETVRKQHLEDITTIGVAHQSHRLRMLDRAAQRAETKGETATLLAVLKQAAEEMGGVLTNERKVKHSGQVGHVHVSLEDAKAELAARLANMVEETPVLPAPMPALDPPTDS